MSNKKFLQTIFIIFFFFLPYIKAQYNTADQFNNPKFLENIVHTILVNNDYNKIEVNQNGVGTIQLKGSVSSYYDKQWIYQTVKRIPGVREVSNEIIVDNPPVSDDILANNIQQGLIYVTSIQEPQNISVDVRKGIVFLSGNVTYADEKNTAYKIASMHEGVIGIVNKIKVQPASEVLFNNELRNYLSKLIKERYPSENKIIVSVKEGEVTFEGSVSSEEIREEITGNINKMKGVNKVNNMLEVKAEVNEKDNSTDE